MIQTNCKEINTEGVLNSPDGRIKKNRDVQEASQRIQDNSNNNSREVTLNMIIREIVLCVTLALTTYGALHNSPPKILRHREATPFFESSSLVKDWHKGQLSEARNVARKYEISFFMYYAPWDAECQYVRNHFNNAAVVLSDRVHFSSVNCWEPGSECRKKFNKISSWPIFIAYTPDVEGIFYQGPRDAVHIVKFLELMMKPMIHITSMNDLVHTLAVCDAVILGYTPLNETNKWYKEFYAASLKSKEYDYSGELCFSVVTSSHLAQTIGIRTTPALRLMMYSKTMDYNWSSSSSYRQIVGWILENVQRPVMHLIPTWQKSSSFGYSIGDSSLLILLTPMNPLYPQRPAYDLLREISMEYQYCSENIWSYELMKLQAAQRKLYQNSPPLELCKTNIREQKPNYKHVFTANKVLKNVTKKNGGVSIFGQMINKGIMLYDDENIVGGVMSDRCPESVVRFNKNDQQCIVEDNYKKVQDEFDVNGMLVEEQMMDDPLSSRSLIQEHIDHQCHLLQFAEKISKPVYPKHSDNSYRMLLGFGCQANFSLNFVAIDSIRNHHFAEWLGIDIEKRKDSTCVILLDTKTETQYVLSDEYNEKTLRTLLHNYTKGELKRSLRRIRDGQHTHYYKSEHKGGLVELNAKTFPQFVKTNGENRLLCICGGACPSHLMLAVRSMVARLSHSKSSVNIKVGRLDMLRHDIPWEYNPLQLPTVIFISSDGKRRSYPYKEPINLNGLLALVRSSLNRVQQMQMLLSLTINSPGNKTKQQNLNILRDEVSSLIHMTLKLWRRYNNFRVRKLLLRHLEILRSISMDLEVIDILNFNLQYFYIATQLDSLHRIWKIGTTQYNSTLADFSSNL